MSADQPPAATPPTSSSSVFARGCSGARLLLVDWSRSDGLTWVYIAKAVLAGLLALYLAMRLELPSPRTALTTVFVVMTPQSGMVLAKSFYRIIGTVVGLIAMLTMIGLFAQAHVLFLISVALWIGICTAGSARNRNFRSYGFLLAGYTAALIGVTNAEAPLGAFDAATTRVLEVVLGILCAAVVSAVVWPQYSSSLLQHQIRLRFTNFVDFIRAAGADEIDRAAMERRTMGFIAEVVGFEALRSYSIFENPLVRLRSARLARLNSESMAAATRFHALHQLLNRVQTQYRGRRRARANSEPPRADPDLAPVVVAITPYLHELGERLARHGATLGNSAHAREVSAQLRDFHATLPARIVRTRERFTAAPDVAERVEFDTAAELLYRFVDELHRYASTYASLEARPRDGERRQSAYIPKTNALMAALAGGRAAIALLLVSAFWIYSAWPSGDFATLTPGTVCALVSASPRPARAAVQMWIGSTLGAVAGYVMTYHLFVDREGFAEMASAMLPFLMFGAWLTTRRQWLSAGLGYCIFFCFLAGPDNINVYDPQTYINNSVALFVAMLISAVAFSVLLPPTTRWVLGHVERDLRRQVRYAAFSRAANRHALAHRFDHQTRDLMFQIGALTAENPPLQRAMLNWMFAVLDVGHALIELRQATDMPDSEPAHAALDHVRSQMAALFDRPSVARWQAAMAATVAAMTTVDAPGTASAFDAQGAVARAVDTGGTVAPGGLQRAASYLHFIRTALLDEQSPLAAYATDASRGTSHAAANGAAPMGSNGEQQ